jgi:hypothetical protein
MHPSFSPSCQNEKHAARIMKSVVQRFVGPTLAILALQCVELPPEPVLPTYDVQASVPLLDRSFSVEDFSSKDSALVASGDGGLIYRSTESFDPLDIGTLEVSPEPGSQSVTLGTFQVVMPAIAPVNFSFEEITGTPPPPGSFVVPAGSFSLPETPIGPLPSFEFIEFDSGTISVTIRNTLPFPLELLEPLVIRNDVLSGPMDTSEIAAWTFAGVLAANTGTQTQVSDLRDVILKPQVKIPSVNVSTSGSGGSVSIDAGDALEVEIGFSGTRVRAARAEIPPQSVLSFEDSTFVVDDSVTLSQAFFRNGSLSIEVENNIDVDVGVSVRFDELQDRITGLPFEVSHQFSGLGTLTVPVDLSDLRYQSPYTGVGTLATFTVGVSTVANADSSKEVRSTDNVRVSIVPGVSIAAERITGRIKPTLVEVESGAQGFSLGEIATKAEGDFTFDSLEVLLKVSTSSGFPADYDIRFIGMDRRRVPPLVDSLLVPPPAGSLQRRVFPTPGQSTSILLDNTAGLNNFLSKFFPHLPDTFIIRGTLLLNPPDIFDTPQGFQTVYDTSRLYSSVDMSFPVRMGITNGRITDTISLNVREQFPKEIASSTRSGSLSFEIENGLPLALWFRSALLRPGPGGVPDTLLQIPTDGPRFIASGVTGSDGAVTNPTISRFTIALSGQEAARFEEAGSLWIELLVESAVSGSIVKVRTTDIVRGLAALGVNPANLALGGEGRVGVHLVPLSIRVSSEFLSYDQYREYFTGVSGPDGTRLPRYLTEEDKDQILKGFQNETAVTKFDLAIMPAGISFFHPDVGGIAFGVTERMGVHVEVPKDYLRILLHGLDSTGSRFSSESTRFDAWWWREWNLSYGRKVPLKVLGDAEMFAGIGLKYLAGFGMIETVRYKTMVANEREGANQYRTEIALDHLLKKSGAEMLDPGSEGGPFTLTPHPAGRGFGIDLGFALLLGGYAIHAGVSDLGSVSWERNLVETYGQYHAVITDPFLGTAEDSLAQAVRGRNREGTSFSTSLPAVLRLGATLGADSSRRPSWFPRQLIVALDFEQGLNGSMGNSVTTRAALGIEYRGLSWLSVRTGWSIGGGMRFRWAAGFSLESSSFSWDVGTENIGLLFSTADFDMYSFATGFRFRM